MNICEFFKEKTINVPQDTCINEHTVWFRAIPILKMHQEGGKHDKKYWENDSTLYLL